MKLSTVSKIMVAILMLMVFIFGPSSTEVSAQKPPPKKKLVSITQADREAAANRAAKKGLKPGVSSKYTSTGKTSTKTTTTGMVAGAATTAMLPPSQMDPGGMPHYFGPYANYANSPLPKGPITGLSLDAGGTGYTAPTVTIADVYGTGSGATATATVVNGVITALTLTNPGIDYTAPIVFIDDTTGTEAAATATIGGAPSSLSGGIRKFVDSLPGVGSANANNLGQYIPAAAPEACTYSGQAADCYTIELREYTEKMHSDLPPTKLRGYVQVNSVTGADVAPIHYLGPTIVAQRDRAVRITFRNKLPTGVGGNLFLPVDTTVMGAGMTPAMGGMPEANPQDPMCGMNPKPADCFEENRATLHLHGGMIPWISDGTTQQWTTPAGESTGYPMGVSVYNVPDMPHGGAVGTPNGPIQGELTFYYNNQQSARLMFYHDHSWGITRLNVYAGEAAGYVLTDQVELDMFRGTNLSGVNPTNARVLPGYDPNKPLDQFDPGIPLVIQDRTFIDPATLPAQDPTWPFTPVAGNLWYPHVYMPNQNPGDLSGMNSFGRWHYTPWFWPPTTAGIDYGPIPNPYYDCGAGQLCTRPWEPPDAPGVPKLSMAMEAFMDTPIVNGTAYPYLQVDPKAYRFRVLNAADDRFWNLQLYVADSTVTSTDGRTNTEVKLVPYPASQAGYPAGYMVPDPAAAGPSFIHIGTEGGFLPKPAVSTNKPIGWNGDQTNFDVGVVNQGTLILGPAERADVIVDFSAFAGKTLILYNDSPAPFPALDVRYDYYTGKGDHTDTGGTPDTLPGFGPNTRTIMQIQVRNITPASAYNVGTLNSVFEKTATKRGVFEVSQEPIIVPNTQYNSAYGKTFASELTTKVNIFDSSKTFQTISGASLTIPFQKKAIHDEASETYDTYGRMSANLGLTGPPPTVFLNYSFASPPVEFIKFSMTPMTEPSPGDGTQIWKITHNGVDTHPIHFHQFNVQLLNRVAWDNATRLPEPYELGWKDTVRVNPLQDTIVALRPVAPSQPFKMGNSVRVIDPSMPTNATLPGPLPAGFADPSTGNPVALPGLAEGALPNAIVNLGSEYTYHCHILGHEEMDMMHTIAGVMTPDAPSGLSALQSNGSAVLRWTDNSMDETSFIVQRATMITGTWTSLAPTMSQTRLDVGATVTFTDTTAAMGNSYFYRVLASNHVGTTASSGFTQPIAPNFPTMQADSGPSNVASVSLLSTVAAPTNLALTMLGNPLRIRLTWTDNATNETGFRIERSVNGGDFVQIAAPGPRNNTGSASYTDANVVVGNTYAYRVRAVNAAGVSAWSNTATIATVAPAAPSNLAAVASLVGGRAQVVLTWVDNATNESSFTIQRATNPTFTANRVTINNVPANSTTLTQPNVPRGTTLYYRIRAVNVVDTSPWSNVIAVVTP